MEKETLDKKGKESMKRADSAAVVEDSFKGDFIIEYLAERMAVSETMIAALLEVTERTLQNWKSLDYQSLGLNNKSRRLVCLYDFVHHASELKVPASSMLPLLQEPITDNEAIVARTPLSCIVLEPDSKCFRATQELIIKQFLTLL